MEDVMKIVNKVVAFLCQKENIALLISGFSFAMSLYNFFRAMWDRRCSFKVDYVSHTCGARVVGCNGKLQIHLNIVNLSSAPLTIVRIFYETNSDSYEFWFPSVKIYKSQDGELDVRSQSMPFTIAGHGALGAYFVVELPYSQVEALKGNASIQLAIQTETKKKSFLLMADNPGYDIKKYGRCV